MNNNRNKVNPTLTDVLSFAKRDALIDTNCHAIAVVDSVDFAKQTVTATMAYRQRVFVINEKGEETREYRPYPVLVDCPFVNLYGGDAGLTMPIKAGDHCLILFNDRDIDNWFQGSLNAPPPTPRLHSFSDGIALIGIRPETMAIGSYSPDKAVLYKGDTKVTVGEKIGIENSSGNLADLLEQLITAIENITTMVDGNPVAINNKAEFTMIKPKVKELLE